VGNVLNLDIKFLYTSKNYILYIIQLALIDLHFCEFKIAKSAITELKEIWNLIKKYQKISISANQHVN